MKWAIKREIQQPLSAASLLFFAIDLANAHNTNNTHKHTHTDTQALNEHDMEGVLLLLH